ncbi:MAG: phosphatase PAP2 family protein [Actinomycetes bacterium]
MTQETGSGAGFDTTGTKATDENLVNRTNRLRDGSALHWWHEAGFILAFYFIYSMIRNFNSRDARHLEALALSHARAIIHLQKTLGIYHEEAIQKWALQTRALIVGSNYFYGSLHFVVTIGVGIFLYRKWQNDYPLWRNTIAIATALALIGFTFWPLMPPRLLPPNFGFIDTLDRYPTIWSFDSGTLHNVSNQFAAMPSVHCAWALWCACALVPRLKSTWAKVIAALYPVCTVTVIVVTGNHYFLDAVAGFTVLGIGYLIARSITKAGRRSPVAVSSTA